MSENTYTTTANGHAITATSRKIGDALCTAITIDGECYTDADSMIGRGDTPETEAKHQANATADDIAEGRLRLIEGKWELVYDGRPLEKALYDTDRDEWVDGGGPENATLLTSWEFDGWNAVRDQLRLYGYVTLGGFTYCVNRWPNREA